MKYIMFGLLLCSLNANSNDTIGDPVEKVFTHIYKTNEWASKESISGTGSELKFTQGMSLALAKLIKLLGITSIADAPCGDLNWMQYVDLGKCSYIGIDIVEELIENNKKTFGPSKEFRHLNLVEHKIEPVDLIICRDMFAHLTTEHVFAALKNFKESGSKYILMTTNLVTEINYDNTTGGIRWINFERAPFNFPKPLILIKEDTPFEWERGKHLGLWLLEDLNL